MRVPSSTNRRSVGANMTPMIDVVFLLIIFFLVSSHLARRENHLPLDLPIASTFGPDNPDVNPLTISVDESASWLVAGTKVNEDELREVLREHQQRDGTRAAIRIRTDRKVQYKFVEPVLRAAATVGVTNLNIAVREESR